MKKTFTFFAISALFLMFLFPVSVKADETLTFKWTQAPNNVVSDGDFSYSGDVWNAVRQDWSDTFVGFNSNVTATSRSTYALNSGTFTFTLRILWRNEDRNNCNVPKIQLNDGTPFTHSQINLSNGVPVNVEYSVTVPSIGSYTIKVITQDGDNWKFGMESLTIPSAAFATTYSVLATASNGSVVGIGSYAAGATVTLTPNPDPYYAFSSWSGLTGVSVDGYEDDNPLTFTMPAGAVSVTANFVSSPCTNTKIIQCEDYDPEITKPSAGHSKPSNYMVQGYRINGNDEGYGTAYGDAFASFRGSGDTEIFYYLYLSAGTYTFTVRCSNGNTKKVVLYNAAGDTKLQELVLGSDWDNKKWNEYTTSSWTAASSAYYYIGLRASNDWAVFDQMTITATSNVFCPNTITMQKSGDDGAAAPTSSPANAAMPGATVTITAGEASANHNFINWTATPSVEFANANAPSTTFVMPSSDVTITANYEASVSSTFTYTTSGSGSITCATASGSSVISGTAISMTAVPSSEYVFKGWTATAGSFSDAAALTTTFTMPAEAAAVTATFAQVDNVITVGSETGSSANNAGGGASITESNISDFDAFAHNVIKLAYSNMSGSDKWYGWNLGKQGSYNSANSAGATGFGFYYKTEAADDAVALWFDPNTGNNADQRGMQLAKTENVWKYVYIEHAVANGWNRSNITIYINGYKEGKTTAHASGAIYIADIAATSITSKDDIEDYHYTNNRGGAMAVNDYGTLCLPMAGTISGATLYSVAGKELGDVNYLVLEDKGTSVEAGKPYITQSTATSYTVTMSGAHSEVQDGNGLVGTYETINLTPYAEPSTLNYFLYANAFKKAGTGVTVGAYRAYLDWGAVSDAPAQAPSARRIRMVIEGTEVQTGMETVTAMPKTTKVLIDGQLFIIREGKRYTLTGARAQ